MVVQLEDYFDFLSPDVIRLKGTRIGIETVLYEYIHEARTPEEIAARYDAVILEQVYATILYYPHNKPAVDAYIADWLEVSRLAREEQARNPPPIVQRALALRRELRAATMMYGIESSISRWRERRSGVERGRLRRR